MRQLWSPLHEAAKVLLIGELMSCAHGLSGALPAQVVAHDIVRTRRQDLLAWFQMSEQHHRVRGDVDEIATVTVSPGMRGRKEASHGASEL